MQLDQDKRGFSFSKMGPLDMRMDPTSKMSARDVINSLSEQELGELIKELGEEKFWRKSAKAIVDARKKKPIETTTELAEVIEKAIPRNGKTHPATRIFQAIRIYVNRELETIEKTLKKAFQHLNQGGLIAVLSFHSLEDRIVKNVFRDLATPMRNMFGQRISEALAENLTKKPSVPSDDETRKNRRSRSAKLRFIKKRLLGQ